MHNPEQLKSVELHMHERLGELADALYMLRKGVEQVEEPVAPVIQLFQTPAEKEAIKESSSASATPAMPQSEAERLANIYRDIEAA